MSEKERKIRNTTEL